MRAEHVMAHGVDPIGHSDWECRRCKPIAVCGACCTALPCRHTQRAEVGDTIKLRIIHGHGASAPRRPRSTPGGGSKFGGTPAFVPSEPPSSRPHQGSR